MNISKGLILKDLLQLKSYLKTLIVYTAIFILIGMANQSPDGINIMLIFMITFGFGMFTMASFDYDEKAKADNYLLTFPLTKKTVVFSRYILIISATIIGMIVGILSTIVICISLNTNVVLPDIAKLLNTALGSILSVSIIEAIQIPCTYKFGTEKGRIYLLIIVAAITLMLTGLCVITQNSNLYYSISEFANFMGGFLPVVLIFLTAIIYYVSYKFSYQNYENKE